jgi:outer membrane murein-binding lipoprotein Lpp
MEYAKMIAVDQSRRYGLVSYAVLSVVGLLWMTGCATRTAALKAEVQTLLKQAMDDVHVETDRLDTELAQLRSEVKQLSSEAKQADAKVGRLGKEVRQLGSEVALVRSDVRHNGTSLGDLAVRVNQIDRRLSRSDSASEQNQAQASGPSEARANPPSRPSKAGNASSQDGATPSALKQGMTQQEVLRLFGQPHAVERMMDVVYWYYADGELKGQYVRFDASTGYVNAWSSFAPPLPQLNFQISPGTQDR